tara:strand:+ start:240 stop:374 length:135 start_codon:yes stop_codon:yes gene_type:complete
MERKRKLGSGLAVDWSGSKLIELAVNWQQAELIWQQAHAMESHS